jgi:hypothetical protein
MTSGIRPIPQQPTGSEVASQIQPTTVRSVWSRILQLYFCPLEDAARQGLADNAWKKYFNKLTYSPGIPVALRWVGHPFYGFPRAPFRLYRRQRSHSDPFVYGKTLIPTSITLTTPQEIKWGNTPMFDVVFEVQIVAGQSLQVWARDDRDQPLPEQFVQMTTSGWGRIRCTGIGSLQVSGQGIIKQLIGISQDDMANLSDWGNPVQIVGMPFKTDEVTLPVYSKELQGYSFGLVSGLEAARQRLAIAAMLQLDCPPIPGIVNSPIWSSPDANIFLQAFVAGGPGATGISFFRDVHNCLINTDDVERFQREFTVLRQLEGPRQIGQAQASNTSSSLNLPVVAVSMLNVATDSFASCALGYGTTDFPPQAEIKSSPGTSAYPTTYTGPSGSSGYRYAYDYLIVEKLKVAIEFIPKSKPWVIDIELAAIAEFRKPPINAANLSVELERRDRPPKRDEPSFETRALSWSISPFPQAYGIAVKRPNINALFLNNPNLGGKGYQAYIPTRPQTTDGQISATQKTIYLDKQGKQPFDGSETNTYYVIGTDVFGRWSKWQETNFISTSPKEQKPGLTKVEFTPEAVNNNTQTGDLVIDFAWDWSDRSPSKIRLYGKFGLFSSPNNLPGIVPPAGFALQSNDAGTPIEISFDAAGTPKITSKDHENKDGEPPKGSVSQLPPNPPADINDPPNNNFELREYRLIIKGANFNFAEGASKVSYAVYADGSEVKRPAKFSTSVGPKTIDVLDPRPPALSFFVPDVLWTSLPDVTRKARAKLTWTPVNNVSVLQYAVWYTTESQLEAKRGQSFDTNLVERATEWKKYIEEYEAANGDIGIFTRIAEIDHPATSFEIEVSAASDGLHFYRISAVSKNAVESSKSSQIFKVAVPQRIKPGQPNLLLRPIISKDVTGIKIFAISGPLPAAAGFRVYRVRQEFLTTELGLMGPPIFDEKHNAWVNDSVSLILGETAIPCKTIIDNQSPSWFPYYYRVQAIGENNPSFGIYPGNSDPTPPQQIYLTPPNPPQIFLQDFIYVYQDSKVNANSALPNNPLPNLSPKVNIYGFQTDLPSQLSPLGSSKIEVFELQQAGTKLTRYSLDDEKLTHQLTSLPTAPPSDNNQGGYTYLAIHHLGQLLHYRSPNNSFPPQYRLVLPIIADNDPDGRLPTRILRLTDPLGRYTEIELSRNLNPQNLPTS